jgi:hypothetical protein
VQKNILTLSTQANLHFITDPAGDLFESLEAVIEKFKQENDIEVIHADVDVAAFFYATRWSKPAMRAAANAIVSGQGVDDVVYDLFFFDSGVFSKVVSKLGKQASNIRLRLFLESSRSRFIPLCEI